MEPRRHPCVAATLGLLLCTCTVAAQQATNRPPPGPILRYDAIHHPVVGTQGMVASQRATASDIGADILRQGGNAVDAAVAVGFVLAVNLPRAGNLGGGGFMLIHLAETGRTVAIDYRERAPARAHRDIFLDAEGNVDQQKARFSHLSAGVPGTVAGLLHALDNYGTLDRATVMAPAVRMAEQGLVVDYDLASVLARRSETLQRHAASRAKFFKRDGSAYRPGDRWVQPALARTLRRIAEHGRQGFYEGETAEMIVAEMAANDGLITREDLRKYQPVERDPLVGTYRGHSIVTMPPPSSGGVHLIQMLNVLEHFPLRRFGMNSAATLHHMTEAMKLAYADRSRHLGDPDFYDVPVSWLTDKTYGEALAGSINPERARPSAEIGPGEAPPRESPDTTHFSVIDRHGNAVANTYTLNFSFGSAITVSGAGFLLNNEMDDFSAKPGTPNAFGLLGGEANAIEPGKRPLSSMTPTMIFREGRPLLVTGSPGGSRIITTVLQHVVNVITFERNVASALHAPRIHHQWLPDRLSYEAGLSPDTVEALRALGHDAAPSGTMGSLQSVLWRDGVFYGASDPRRPEAGAASVAP